MKGNYNNNFILEGNALEKLKEIDDDSIDLIVTDPPYGYSFMGKEWDKAVVSVAIWKECLRVLKAGAFAFIMSAPRQDVLSRMIVNLQDAGFRTDFTSIYYSYASGFPKAANTFKMLQKRGNPKDELNGSYLGFQPKPAVEVVLTVMKPLSEKTFVDQALSNGKGVTWLDDCRIPFQNEKDKAGWYSSEIQGIDFRQYSINNGYRKQGKHQSHNDKKVNDKGRFPANLLVSDDALNDGKIRKSGKFENHHVLDSKKTDNIYGIYERDVSAEIDKTYGDSGSYSRYFDLDSWYKGRFPANLLVSDDALNDGKIRPCSGRPNSIGKKYKLSPNEFFREGHHDFIGGYMDSGSYSRYFSLDSWYDNRAQFIITPKASTSERNKGLDGIEIVLSWNESNTIQEERQVRLHMDTDTFHVKDIDEFGIQQKDDLDLSMFLFGKNIMEKFLKDCKSIIKTDKNSTIESKILNSLHQYIINGYIQGVTSQKQDGSNLVLNVNGYYMNQTITDLKIKNGFNQSANNVEVNKQLLINVKENKNSHATVKPIKLMSYLITMGSRENDIVLDPFCGSGTTLIAAHLLNRRWIGIELNTEYAEIARKRIEPYLIQQKLL